MVERKNLAAFNAREVKRARKEGEKETNISLHKNSESQIKRQNLPNEVSEKGKRGRSQGVVRREASARGAMEKGRSVRVIEGKVWRDDPIEYFLPTGG